MLGRLTVTAIMTPCNWDQNHTQVCNSRQHQLLHAQDRWGVNVRKFGSAEVHSAAAPQQWHCQTLYPNTIFQLNLNTDLIKYCTGSL